MCPYLDTLSCFQTNPSFLLNAVCLAEKQQFYILWFYPIGPRTLDLPHSMRARKPLRANAVQQTFDNYWVM